MRFLPLALVAILLLIGVVAWWLRGGDPVAVEPAPAQGPLQYAALGDSLATGAGADTSYVTEYAAWLREQAQVEVTVRNFAVDGWTSEQLLAAIRTDPSMREAVAAADVVTWNIGGNDLLAALALYLQGACGGADGQECLRAAVDRAAANGTAVLDELLRLRGGVSAGLRTLDLYLPFMEDPRVAPYLPELRPYLDGFNDRLRDAVRERGVAAANVSGAFHGAAGDDDPVASGLISPDGLHPSDRGHAVIAAELASLGLELDG